MILQEEILHSLDQETALKVRKYVLWLIARPWWVDRKSMVINEGGVLGMETTVASYFNEELLTGGDEGEETLHRAFVNFRRYINSEYGTSATVPSRTVSLEPLVENNILLLKASDSDSSSRDVQSLPELSLHDEVCLYLSRSEQETLSLLVSTLSTKEVAQYLGLSYAAAAQRVRRLRNKLRPLLEDRLAAV